MVLVVVRLETVSFTVQCCVKYLASSMRVSLIYSAIQRATGVKRKSSRTRSLRRCRNDAMRYVLSHPTDGSLSQDCGAAGTKRLGRVMGV